MQLSAEVPGAREKLKQGLITVTTASQMHSAFKRQERQARMARRARVRARTEDGAAVAVMPDGAAAVAVPVLDVSARRALVEQAVGKSTRHVEQLIAQVAPEAAVPRDRVRLLGDGRWELKAAIDAECQRGLEELKGLLSHVDPSMTYGELIARLVREGLDRHDPRRRGAGRRCSAPETKKEQAGGGAPQRKAESQPDAAPASAPETGTQPAASGIPEAESDTPQAAARSSAPETQPRAPAAPVPAPRSKRQPTGPATSAPETRTIPAASKREVWQRDAGRCSYVDPESGRRCTARYLLQVDHIRPYALGGDADPDNLRLLCAAHHRHRHADSSRRRPPP